MPELLISCYLPIFEFFSGCSLESMSDLPSGKNSELKLPRNGFLEALVERLRQNAEIASSKEKKRIHQMILWLKGEGRTK